MEVLGGTWYMALDILPPVGCYDRRFVMIFGAPCVMGGRNEAPRRDDLVFSLVHPSSKQDLE